VTARQTAFQHFNLDTKATGMTTGTWQLKPTLSDGSTHTAWVE
jgi:hypothetical protein